MRYRAVSVREDVYEALARLSEINGTSISELLRQLLTAYQAINEMRDLLRQCLSQLSANENKVNVNGKAITTEPLINLEDNPWVRIIRSRVVNGEGREGH